MYDVQFGGYDSASNWQAGGGYYPGMGDSIGLSATTPQSANPVLTDGGYIVPGTSPSGGVQGNPIQGAVIFIVLVVGIMLLVHKFGKGEEDFSNLKASAYNALIVAFLAAAGLPLVKYGFGTLASMGVPGARPVFAYVQGA